MIKSLNTPEFALLVAATARPPADHHRAGIDALGEPGRIDWTFFLRLIDRHRVAALVFDALCHQRDVIPVDAFSSLRAKAMRDRAQALQNIGVLRIILSKLAEAGIEAISLKGPTLAQLAFCDPTLRQSKDLDILIDPRDVRSALATLTAAGFEIAGPSNFSMDDLNLWQRHRKDLALLHVSTGTEVELHWRLSENRHSAQLGAWGGRQLVTLGSLQTETFGTETLLSYLCLHGAGHSWFRVKWLADVYALVRGANADVLDAFANATRDNLAAGAMLATLHKVYGVPLPDVTSKAIARSWRMRFADRVSCHVLNEVKEPETVRFLTTRMGASNLLQSNGFRQALGSMQYMLIDWPTVARHGGTPRAYTMAIIGRVVFWLRRKITAGVR